MNLHYFYGKTGKSISTDGRASSETYGQGIGSSIGGGGNVRAETSLGRKSSLTASQSIWTDPSLVLGAFGSLEVHVDPEVLPETGQSNAFIEQRSLSATSDLTLERRWNAKQTTNTTLTYSRRTYLDELGYDSSGRSASVSHQWAATRTFSVDGSYLFADTAYSDSGSSTGEQPLTNHGFELGATYARRVSPTRQLRLEWGGGATYVQTLSTIDRSPQDYWMPSGHGTLRVDLGRSWAVAPRSIAARFLCCRA